MLKVTSVAIGKPGMHISHCPLQSPCHHTLLPHKSLYFLICNSTLKVCYSVTVKKVCRLLKDSVYSWDIKVTMIHILLLHLAFSGMSYASSGFYNLRWILKTQKSPSKIKTHETDQKPRYVLFAYPYRLS